MNPFIQKMVGGVIADEDNCDDECCSCAVVTIRTFLLCCDYSV